MKLGYKRVSKSDGSQRLQVDALMEAVVKEQATFTSWVNSEDAALNK